MRVALSVQREWRFIRQQSVARRVILALSILFPVIFTITIRPLWEVIVFTPIFITIILYSLHIQPRSYRQRQYTKFIYYAILIMFPILLAHVYSTTQAINPTSPLFQAPFMISITMTIIIFCLNTINAIDNYDSTKTAVKEALDEYIGRR